MASQTWFDTAGRLRDGWFAVIWEKMSWKGNTYLNYFELQEKLNKIKTNFVL